MYWRERPASQSLGINTQTICRRQLIHENYIWKHTSTLKRDTSTIIYRDINWMMGTNTWRRRWVRESRLSDGIRRARRHEIMVKGDNDRDDQHNVSQFPYI
jgi:hypothetical protein